MSERIFGGDTELLADYLKELSRQVGLRDWLIKLAETTPQEHGMGDNATAMCHVVDGRKYGVIYFAGDWASEPPENLRQTCTHELLHCHFAELEVAVAHGKDLLGEMAYGPIRAAHKHAVEVAIDSMAYEWARHLPLPQEWLERATDPEGVSR